MIKLNGKPVNFTTFPNGETKLIEKSIHENVRALLMNRLHFKYESDSDLIKLMLVKDFLDTLKVDTSILIYYMPYSRMDRSENGSAFTLKSVTKFINSLNFYSVSVIEPHSDVTMALLDNAEAIMITHELLPAVMNEVEFNKDTDYVVFPDAGAQKRYSKLHIDKTLVCFKERDFETGMITNLKLIGDSDVTANKALIVDDLSSKGGTFVLTAEALKARGFNEVYLLVGHAENSIFDGSMFNIGSPIDKIFTTDSIYTGIRNVPRLKVYSIEELIE